MADSFADALMSAEAAALCGATSIDTNQPDTGIIGTTVIAA